MAIARVFLFPTLVVACVVLPQHSCWAAKTADVELGAETSAAGLEKKTSSGTEADRATIDIAIPPPARAEEIRQAEYFYPYRRALTLRLGTAARSTTYIEGTTATPTVSGVQFFFLTDQLKRYEGTADLYSDGTGGLQLAERWIFSRSKLRPYAKAGLGLIVVPRDQLATFAKFTQYLVTGAAGAEYLVYKSQSLRAEIEAAFSLKGLQTMITAGYVWAW